MMRPRQETPLDKAILLAGNTLLADFAKKHNVTVAELRAKYGSRELIEIRVKAMETLWQAGFNMARIGAVLDRAGNTVSHQLNHNGGHGD